MSRETGGLPPALAVTGAAAVAVVVVAVILLFGIRQPPGFDAVSEGSDDRLAGRIAFVREEDDRSCVVVMELPVATEREIVCGEASEWYGQDVWWASADELEVVRYETGGPFIVTFDPSDGRELDRRVQTVDDGPEYQSMWPIVRASDGAELTTYSDDGSVRVEVAVGDRERTVMSARGPRDYSLWDASWSPDGGWAIVSDSEGRLLLVASTAPLTTFLLADDSHSPAWGAG